jgi:hypothetical protein
MMPVTSFNPNPSLHIIAGGLTVFIMSRHPVSETIIVTGNPNSLPGSWNPFSSHLPMAWDIFRWWRWRIIPRFWRWVGHLRWMGMGKELIGHCS